MLRAGETCEPASRAALAELYNIYWYPLYAFVRRRGLSPDAAADLLQAFFAELIDGALCRAADQSKGRFRTYLLGGLKHFIGDQWDRERAQKRGGGVMPVSIDDAESRYGLEPSHNLTPERLFERRWAMTLLGRVMQDLGRDYAEAGKHELFDRIKDLIAGPSPNRSYADIGSELGMSEAAMKVAVHRLRQRYREILFAEISETVATPEDIEDEIKDLRAAVAGGL